VVAVSVDDLEVVSPVLPVVHPHWSSPRYTDEVELEVLVDVPLEVAGL